MAIDEDIYVYILTPMSTDTIQLSPIQSAVLDVYRRLDGVGLAATATYEVVAVHARINRSMAASVARELVDQGLLTAGDEARTKRSLVLTDAGRAYTPPPLRQPA